MSLPKYPAYKDSGVPWLGCVPTTWSICRLKDVAAVINGYPFDSKLFDANGSYPLIRIRDLNSKVSATRYNGEFIQAAAITSSDVLIGMDGDFNVGLWHGSEVALLNQRMCCVRARSNDLSKFLLHALPIPLTAINDVTYSTTVKHLSSLDVEKIRFALPQHNTELSAIAAFLDRETGKIDALIAEQEKLITLLTEKRQATISYAVIRGLNPDAPLKNSGSEWLGEVPAHWEVACLKRFWTVTDCKHITAEFVDEGIPLASIREVQGRYVFLDNAKRTTESFYEQLIEGGRKPLPGDLIFSRNATVGEVAQVTEDHPSFAMGQDVCLLRKTSHSYSSDYLQAVIRSSVVVEQLKNMMVGSTFKRVNVEEIRNLIIPMPPSTEQFGIAKFIEIELAKLDILKTDAERFIDLLKERRRALVAAAVTGQIDVRGTVTKKMKQEVAEAMVA
jgi:type I restriction enzyme S subunit